MESFDVLAAQQYATVVGREKQGRPISMADAQIAAICLAHSATLATRNTGDFAGYRDRSRQPMGRGRLMAALA